MAAVLDIILKQIGNEIIAPGIEIRGTGGVLAFPDKAVFYIVAVFGVHIAVVEMGGKGTGFQGGVGGGGVPAERLEVDAVFSHIFNFPVGGLGNAFIVITQHRLGVLISRDAAPAPVGALFPERADIHSDGIFAFTFRFYRC